MYHTNLMSAFDSSNTDGIVRCNVVFLCIELSHYAFALCVVKIFSDVNNNVTEEFNFVLVVTDSWAWAGWRVQ